MVRGNPVRVIADVTTEQRLLVVSMPTLPVGRVNPGTGVCEPSTEDLDNDSILDGSDPCLGDPRNLCFGPVAVDGTTGNVYLSEDRGESWRCVGTNFPPVYSVRFG